MDLPINKIICGDCLKVMKDWPDNCVDLVLTDPPYGLDWKYDLYKDTLENLKLLLDKSVPRIKDISLRAIMFSYIKNLWIYPPADWILSYSWDTTAGYGRCGICQWTPILFYGEDVKGFGSINGILKSDSIHYSGGAEVGFLRSCKDKNHPCPKPLNIIRWCIRRFSNPNDIILDPFCGSGTTCVAAKMLGRRYIGIDISEKYCEITRKRLRGVRPNLFEKSRKKIKTKKASFGLVKKK